MTFLPNACVCQFNTGYQFTHANKVRKKILVFKKFEYNFTIYHVMMTFSEQAMHAQECRLLLFVMYAKCAYFYNPFIACQELDLVNLTIETVS